MVTPSPVTLKRFENLSLDEIYHPFLDTVTHTVLSICTLINTIICPLMIYIIIRHSTKDMDKYRHLLVIQLIFSYFFDVITFAWKPSLLWPLRLGFPNGWVDLGPRTVYIFFMLEVSFMFNIVVIQLFIVLYRLVATYDHTFWHVIYSNTKVLYAAIFGTIAVTQIIVITPILYDEPNAEDVRLLVSAEIPAMAKLIKLYPKVAGYHPKLARGGIDFILIVGMVMIILMPLIMVIIFTFFAYRLRYVKRTFSTANFRLHQMLFKSLIIQIFLLVVFLLIPAEIFVLTMFFEARWGSYAASACVVVISFHMLLDSLSLIYFIKPYRFYILKKLNCLYFKRNSVFAQSTVSGIPKILITRY